MFSVDEFKKSRLYQSIRDEVLEKEKSEIIANLLNKGFTVEAIADIVNLDVDKVREFIEKRSLKAHLR